MLKTGLSPAFKNKSYSASHAFWTPSLRTKVYVLCVKAFTVSCWCTKTSWLMFKKLHRSHSTAPAVIRAMCSFQRFLKMTGNVGSRKIFLATPEK